MWLNEKNAWLTRSAFSRKWSTEPSFISISEFAFRGSRQAGSEVGGSGFAANGAFSGDPGTSSSVGPSAVVARDWLLRSTCFLGPLGIHAPVFPFRGSTWIRGIWRSTGLRTSFWPFSRSITACPTAFRRCTSSLSSKASFETAEVRRAGDWVGLRAKAQSLWVRFALEAFFRDLKVNYLPVVALDQCSLRKSDRKCVWLLRISVSP